MREAVNIVLATLLFALPANAGTVQITGNVEIHLTWSTPGDPDQSDMDGTNLDVHLRHPNASNWFELPWDAYSLNPNPDWGAPGSPNDPLLLMDDVDGLGPESLVLDEPESGATYRIGVDYVSDNGYGTSLAAIQIIDNGQVVYEVTNLLLHQEGDFIEVIDVVSSSVNEAPALSPHLQLILALMLLFVGTAVIRLHKRHPPARPAAWRPWPPFQPPPV